jgi:serine/threonine protein phosphatase PrpC
MHLVLEETDSSIVLMTDGIYEFASNEEIMDILKNSTGSGYLTDLKDNNATYLVRNCLAGEDHDVDGLAYMVNNPNPRDYRDDMTALIINLDNSEKHTQTVDHLPVPSISTDISPKKDRHDLIYEISELLTRKKQEHGSIVIE